MNEHLEIGQRKLEDVLRRMMAHELSSRNEVVCIISDLRFIYLDENDKDSGFRHQYSRISSIIFEAGRMAGKEGKSGDEWYFNDPAQILASNMDTVLSYAEEEERNLDLIRMLRKLYDHVNLELLRINYNANISRERDSRIGLLSSQIAEHERRFSEQQAASKRDIEESQQRMQRNYIAILGIFAAVVVTFMSGTAFSSSVLQNIDKASIYRLVFIVLLVGLFMFLMISSLYVFLNRVSSVDNRKTWCLIVAGSIVFIALMICVGIAKWLSLGVCAGG